MMIIPPNTAEMIEKPMKTLVWEIKERNREIKYEAITSTFPQEKTGFFVFSRSWEERPLHPRGYSVTGSFFSPSV